MPQLCLKPAEGLSQIVGQSVMTHDIGSQPLAADRTQGTQTCECPNKEHALNVTLVSSTLGVCLVHSWWPHPSVPGSAASEYIFQVTGKNCFLYVPRA